MRKILWVIIIMICLIPVSFIGYAYLIPENSEVQSRRYLYNVFNRYINDENINVAEIQGDDPNINYVRSIAEYLDRFMKIRDEMKREKNLLIALIQPRNLASPQSAEGSIEKIAAYEAKINEIHARLERNVEDLIVRVKAIERKGLVFDTVSLVEAMEKEKQSREKKVQNYLALSQYAKALLEFAKSRDGYYQLNENGALVFTAAADQDYYNQLATGINNYNKQIDDQNAQDIKEMRLVAAGLAQSLE